MRWPILSLVLASTDGSGPPTGCDIQTAPFGHYHYAPLANVAANGEYPLSSYGNWDWIPESRCWLIQPADAKEVCSIAAMP